VVYDWVAVVANVGFPIAVAIYLLVRIDPALRRLTQAIERLTIVLDPRSRALPPLRDDEAR
jgi:hypothetical protein